MFVRSLRLAGFKSFAQPTTLEFERGVNVIVGPNGSGKSNIADALQWVMGSQAPSSLRGGSMEDVIFAGSAALPRLGSATVELTLDNSDRMLPLDLNEITISRSTDRSGTSEYRINGAPCRLLDIAELLSDTGIGRSLHSIVGQGQLDAILQARPEDRRTFIEEAAQIGKYRRRKERALRKIERVEDNLTRINDVLTELRRTLRPLKRQAGLAAQHSELLGRQRDLRQRLAATELHQLAKAEALQDPEAEAHRAALLAEELAALRARLDSANSERAALAAAAEDAVRVAHGIARASDRLEALGHLAGERAGRIAARLASETEEGYQERIRLFAAERERAESELAIHEARAAKTKERAAELGAVRAAAAARLQAAEARLGVARLRETDSARALVRAEGEEAAGRATLGSAAARVQALTERRAVAQAALATTDEQIGAAELEVQGLEADLDRVTELAAAAETQLEEARQRAEHRRAALGASEAQRAALQARHDTLEEVGALLADLPGAVERLRPLTTRAREQLELARAETSEAEAAAEQAEVEAEECWGEVARRDEELRRLDALLAGAAERLAGLRRRKEQHEVELATLDEELAHAQEQLADAERRAAEARAALPERRAAAEQAQQERAALEAEVTALRAALEAAQAEAAEAELAVRGAEERALATKLRIEEAEAGVADAQRALEGLAGLRAELEDRRRHTEGVAAGALAAAELARAWAVQAEVRAETARAEAQRAEARLADLQARERELTRNLELATARRTEAEIRRAETRARAEAIAERSLDEWGLSADELLALEPLTPEEAEEARAEAERLERDLKRLGPVNPRAGEEYRELAEREAFLVGQIEDLKRSRRDLLQIVDDVDATIVSSFSAAYEAVAHEFEGVFSRLFPGGSGKLKLTDPHDLLATGIDIEARPPGKNVRKLSLLSGGERSLVALAFLFAIFRAKPSPFYLLDEVEAALDDINLQRFIALVGELEEHAQVLIVTHQKRTMEAADVLYGVTMGKDGVSRVVSTRLEDVPA
jgi:chromosome segregation protein